MPNSARRRLRIVRTTSITISIFASTTAVDVRLGEYLRELGNHYALALVRDDCQICSVMNGMIG